ncbi:MAG: hypothetical protein HOE44_02810 [Candidatus Marinimicrobia bacterium]|nr:hypothetical protein [Candidatus Neomarinimicrobiota bacterium]
MSLDKERSRIISKDSDHFTHPLTQRLRMITISEITLMFLLSFFVTVSISWLILVTEEIHYEYTHDLNSNNVHQHHSPVPRIGGLAILLGAVTGSIYLYIIEAEHTLPIIWIWVAIIPAFLGGFIEDFTQNVSPHIRLTLTFLSGLIICSQGDLTLNSIGWGWFDQNILSNQLLSILLTAFMISGASQATNIIDGFNGLLSGFSIIALIAFAIVLIQVGDHELLALTFILMGTLSGFSLFNFPSGKIFAGDGGAYLIGFLLAALSLLAIKRNNEISPWFPLLVMIYPVFEVLFSIYRKKFIHKISPYTADRIHLHILVYRKFSQTLPGILGNHPNPTTAILMWGLSMVGVLPAVIWWDQSSWLITWITAFCIIYTYLYQHIVQISRPRRTPNCREI